MYIPESIHIIRYFDFRASLATIIYIYIQGEYASANNKEDDVAIIASFVNYRPDDIGDTVTTATQLSLLNGAFSSTGIIGKTGEKDVFSIAVGVGSLTAQITLANSQSSNLDAQLEVYIYISYIYIYMHVHI